MQKPTGLQKFWLYFLSLLGHRDYRLTTLLSFYMDSGFSSQILGIGQQELYQAITLALSLVCLFVCLFGCLEHRDLHLFVCLLASLTM